jgi:hypothetical protein
MSKDELKRLRAVFELRAKDGRLEHFESLIRAAEREAFYDEWHSCVMSDLEHGVKCLNEKAVQDWYKNYPAQAKMFPAWIEARGTE